MDPDRSSVDRGPGPALGLPPRSILWNRSDRVAGIMAITLDTCLAPSPETVWRELDGEAVILHLESGQYYGLDPVGTRIWSLLGDHPRPRDLAAVLAGEYDVSPRRLEADVLELLTRLAERKLIHVTA